MVIAVVADPRLFSADYRAFQPMAALSRRGHRVALYRVGEDPLDARRLLDADVVHIHRIVDRRLRRVVEQVATAGVAIVWDNDDDITSVPRHSRGAVRAGSLESQRRRAGVAAMVSLADVVTTPSSLLAAQYRDAGAKAVQVIENYLPDSFPGQRRRPHDGVVVCWTAAGEHAFDLQELSLRDTLGALLDVHRDLHVTSIGLDLGLRSERYRHISHVPFLRLASHLAEFDIGIAPLADIPFNRARSNIKLKEYGAAGLAWLASPVGPYVGMGERQGGRLVPHDGWYQAIDRLVLRGRERRKLAKRAARWAKAQTVDTHVSVWETALYDAIERASSRKARRRPRG